MRKFFLILFIFITLPAYANDFSGHEFDYNFIDNPFAGQKMVSDKEFEDAIKQKTPQPREKKKWWWQKDKETPLPPTFDLRLPSETGSLKEVFNIKPVITLGATIVDAKGQTLPSGHYQVSVDDGSMVLSQGQHSKGTLRARLTEDSWSANSIIYARVVDMGEDFVKIIYSNLDVTYEGIARIKK
ncbi:hypothetical protein tpqmel_0680 [Candidatus Gastranaerophilus sp. (ex Termes propinquus)]|nr:hypothetical protein tpqmel_0680 [Candidatus Gastranaerophilus sp. (ex Termes propinquus)]